MKHYLTSNDPQRDNVVDDSSVDYCIATVVTSTPNRGSVNLTRRFNGLFRQERKCIADTKVLAIFIKN